MTAPKRPPLADTLARIDAAIAGQPPRCTLTGHRRDVGSTGPFTAERCTRDALPGSDRCSLHTPLGEYLLGLPLDVRPPRCRCVVKPIEPVVRDGNTFTVTQPGVYLLSNAPAPEPGWLARALRRLGVW